MKRKDLPSWAKWEDEWSAKVGRHSGYLMTVEDFRVACGDGEFIDYDGMGDMIIDGKIVTPEIEDSFFPKWVKPSKLGEIPDDVTHILWYNR